MKTEFEIRLMLCEVWRELSRELDDSRCETRTIIERTRQKLGLIEAEFNEAGADIPAGAA